MNFFIGSCWHDIVQNSFFHEIVFLKIITKNMYKYTHLKFHFTYDAISAKSFSIDVWQVARYTSRYEL